MKLSEELIWRGFQAETTVKDPSFLDEKPHKFYLGADPSADSLTIGNLAALMMCAVFTRHGYTPHLLVGGATGQIGDPKDTGERDLKPLEEVEHNKTCIAAQMEKCLRQACLEASEGLNLRVFDNYDWFKDINYLSFLREIGKSFSMTQLLDRQFIQARIGEGGSGISYAEFSYTLIQGYDFLHLFREHGIDFQLCGADQYGNASSGIHLIKRFENADSYVWSTPLIIDPVSGRKFGKSEGNAVWLASTDNGSGNFTSVFDFYQFWLNQPDESCEYLLKIYTIYDRETIENALKTHSEAPERRFAQKLLAYGVTEVVHGTEAAEAAKMLSEKLFARDSAFTEAEIKQIAETHQLPTTGVGKNIVETLTEVGLVSSKNEARKMLSAGAISALTDTNTKITSEDTVIDRPCILKRGKNKFAVVQ